VSDIDVDFLCVSRHGIPHLRRFSVK
jgi:hypothetical protein